MSSPGWLAGVLAAVVLVVALFSAVRLMAARGGRDRGEVDTDVVHALMGVAMAGMFVPGLATLPEGAWGAMFGAGAVWFAGRALRDRVAAPRAAGRWCACPVPHLVDCLAMVYVLWAVPAAVAGHPGRVMASGGMGGTGGGGGPRWSVVGLVLAVAVCGYVVWLLDRLPGVRGAAAVGPVVGAVGAATGGPPALIPARTEPEARPRGRLALGWPAAAGDAAAVTPGRPAFRAPRAAACCKIVMGVAMAIMLIDLF